ncbi:hypothetical protein SAMN02787118_10310 [Streptomyces mirabilis]|uniref:Uncharacterized protein n=1 Tax=Streptomyces mirabilis TaxID=68239 RepID=A0A1I2EPD8_9ACTN|nr:hypothetical protein SAMN02787118_10310 [Streptomyces mirabilis]
MTSRDTQSDHTTLCIPSHASRKGPAYAGDKGFVRKPPINDAKSTYDSGIVGENGPDLCAQWQRVQNYPLGAVTYMLFAADKGDITTIIGGIAPDWGPFGSLGNEAKTMIQVVMAVAILLCLGIAIWGAAKQRIGATALRDTFSAEQGKGLIIAGLTGVFIIGSLGTLFTIVYGMAV